MDEDETQYPEGMGIEMYHFRVSRGSAKHPLTMRNAAEEIGIHYATYCRIENGATPDLKSFELICRWMDYDARELLGL